MLNPLEPVFDPTRKATLFAQRGECKSVLAIKQMRAPE